MKNFLLKTLALFASASTVTLGLTSQNNQVSQPKLSLTKQSANDDENYKYTGGMPHDRDYFLFIDADHIANLYNILMQTPQNPRAQGWKIYNFFTNNAPQTPKKINWKYGGQFYSDLCRNDDEWSCYYMIAQENKYVYNGGFKLKDFLSELNSEHSKGSFQDIEFHMHCKANGAFYHNSYYMEFILSS